MVTGIMCYATFRFYDSCETFKRPPTRTLNNYNKQKLYTQPFWDLLI
jgi:hypothetical protein